MNKLLSGSMSLESLAAPSSGSELKEKRAELLTVLGQLNEKITDLRQRVQNATTKIKDGQLPTQQGISLLEMKNHLMLQYLMGLAQLVLLKAQGHSIAEHPILKHMVRLRVYLEKIRPLEKKLKYQIDKMVQSASLQVSDAAANEQQDPLRFRPNLQALSSKGEALQDVSVDGDGDADMPDEDEEGSRSGGKSAGVYRPPKLAAVHFEGEEKGAGRRQRDIMREKARVAGSSFLAEIRSEFSDAPEVIADDIKQAASKDRVREERNEFEEEHFVRLMDTKADKQRRKRFERINPMEELDVFDDVARVTKAMSGGLDRDDFLGSAGGKGGKGSRGGNEDDVFFMAAEGAGRKGKSGGAGGKKGSKKGKKSKKGGPKKRSRRN